MTKAAIIGAGIGGLASALRLAHAGLDVTVFEAAETVGGKIRTFPSVAGPVDAGPTVLTMRPVFDELFAAAGERLADHLTLTRLTVLARHFWSDGVRLDLMSDEDGSAAEIRSVFGSRAEREFRRFAARAARLFRAFDTPMMQAAAPDQARLGLTVMRNPRLALDMAPHRSLAGLLDGAFSEPKLAQLFGRFATYVGGSPYAAPALLGLIWDAEARGVWAVGGGMHRIAQVLADLATARGATIRTACPVRDIEIEGEHVAAIRTEECRFAADVVLFNGDPRALTEGRLGRPVQSAIPRRAVEPRSLSAHVHAFAAESAGLDLAYHNVFFADDPRAEFGPIAEGRMPEDATLYICAQDRAHGPVRVPERFEIIRNAPPLSSPTADQNEEIAQCQTLVFERLARFGLRFTPQPGPETLTTPAGFNALFPASLGSLYGRSPHGLTAGLKRPRARTAISGLYLCGGGAHPGAGVPMATLSARHAAEAIVTDLASTSMSRRTATPGGMSTGSPTTAPAPSPSSAS